MDVPSRDAHAKLLRCPYPEPSLPLPPLSHGELIRFQRVTTPDRDSAVPLQSRLGVVLNNSTYINRVLGHRCKRDQVCVAKARSLHLTLNSIPEAARQVRDHLVADFREFSRADFLRSSEAPNNSPQQGVAAQTHRVLERELRTNLCSENLSIDLHHRASLTTEAPNAFPNQAEHPRTATAEGRGRAQGPRFAAPQESHVEPQPHV